MRLGGILVPTEPAPAAGEQGSPRGAQALPSPPLSAGLSWPASQPLCPASLNSGLRSSLLDRFPRPQSYGWPRPSPDQLAGAGSRKGARLLPGSGRSRVHPPLALSGKPETSPRSAAPSCFWGPGVTVAPERPSEWASLEGPPRLFPQGC